MNLWLDARGAEPGPLFPPVDHVGRVRMKRMGYRGLHDLIRRTARAAGVESFRAHDCRRTFVSDLLDAGADLVSVQGLAGHANVNQTARYDRRGERAQRKAAELIRLPIVTARA